MGESVRLTVDSVIRPSGASTDDLPTADAKRWSPRRQAAVVAAVRTGLMSLEDACDPSTLHTDESLSWQERVHRFGLKGLRRTPTELYAPSGAGHVSRPAKAAPPEHSRKSGNPVFRKECHQA